MKTPRAFLTAFVSASLLAACAGAPVQLGTRTTTAPPPTGESRTITAEACGFQLLLLIPININDRMSRAYQSLQLQAGDAVIRDVEVMESWTYGFVGTTYCTTLQAKAVRQR